MTVRLPPHRVSTRHLQAIYPFVNEGGLGGRGVYIGAEPFGGAFCYDPFVLYASVPRVLANPNMLVLGDVGTGKSSLLKTYLWRQLAFGRRAWIVDPKGEYGALARAAGSTPIRLGPSSPVRLNPLDPGRGRALEGDELIRQQVGLLSALAGATLRRPLLPEEETGCLRALRAAHRRRGGPPTMPEVAEALLFPEACDVAELNTSVEAHAVACREIALSLRRLCEGDLAGMFDGPTTEGLDLDGSVVVLDLSELRDSEAIPLLMLCATRWLTASLLNPAEQSKRIIVLDECWRLIREPAVARWMQANWKLCRQYGIANVAVMHRVTDIDAAGNAGSEQVALARGLVADCGTQVLYRQDREAVSGLKRVLEIPDAVAHRVPQLPQGSAIWRVANRTFEVHHVRSQAELDLTDTDQGMFDRPQPAATGATP